MIENTDAEQIERLNGRVAELLAEVAALKRHAQRAPKPSAWRACWVSLNTRRTQLFEIESEAKAKASETGGCVIPLSASPPEQPAAAPDNPLRAYTVEQLQFELAIRETWKAASPPEQPAALCPKCKTKLQGPRLVTPNPHKDMIAYWCLTCDYTTLVPEQPAAARFQPHENCNCLMCIAEGGK